MKSFLNLLIMMVQEILIKKLYIQYARTQSKKCTFSRRSAPVWNTKLSQLTKCCTNVNSFKRLLDNETFFIENKFYFDQY